MVTSLPPFNCCKCLLNVIGLQDQEVNMICPHCKEVISIRVTQQVINKIKSYRKKGLSYREISNAMADDGFHVSHATVGKVLRN